MSFAPGGTCRGRFPSAEVICDGDDGPSGFCYLRKLLVVGATSVIRRSKTDGLAAAPWIRSLMERRPARVVTVAMANKTARIAWAVLTRGEVYRPAALA